MCPLPSTIDELFVKFNVEINIQIILYNYLCIYLKMACRPAHILVTVPSELFSHPLIFCINNRAVRPY